MRTFLLSFVYLIIVLLAIPVLLVCMVGRWESPIMTIGKGAVSIGLKILGISVEVTGIERIESDRAYVFLANHLSFLDGPLIIRLIPQPVKVIFKKEIMRLPVIGLAMKQVGFIPVSRRSGETGGGSVNKATRVIKEKGCSFLVFPEGTRSRNGKLQAFRSGGFYLALNSRVPIIPITIRGTHELMQKGSFFVKKGKIKVVFHAAVSTQEYNEDSLPQLMDKVRDIIAYG